MSFVQPEFLVFVLVALAGYWSLSGRRAQNVFLLVASYVFYGWLSPRLCLLLAAVTLGNYAAGRAIGRFPARRLFPEGALGVLAHIVEDCLDEWVARVMVHYRWHYPDSARFAAGAIAGGDAQAAEQIAAWGPRACRATGTETVFHQRAAEDEYRQLLTAAEEQLDETRFLLGDRPTVVDCMFLGGLHAHTLHDPDPRKIVLGYPRIVAWYQQNIAPDFAPQVWADDTPWAPFPDSTPFARHVLKLTAEQYRPFLLANAQALKTGSRAFTIDTGGEPASYLCRPYPEQARMMIRQRIANRLDAPTGDVVQRWLAEQGLSDVFGR